MTRKIFRLTESDFRTMIRDKFYDIEDGEFSEPYDDYTVPIYVEAGDYFSDQVSDVVAVLNMNGTVQ